MLAEQVENLPRQRVAAESGFLENRGTVDIDFESPAA
jgi:hypothetical protein